MNSVVILEKCNQLLTCTNDTHNKGMRCIETIINVHEQHQATIACLAELSNPRLSSSSSDEARILMQHVTSLPDMIPRLMQQQSTYLNEQMQVLRRLAMDDVQRTCVMAASLRKDVHAKVSKSSLPLPLAYLAKVQAEGPQSVVVGGSGFALPNSADEPLVSFVEACELVDSVTTTLERDGQARKFLVMEAFKLQQQFRQQNQQPKQHGIDLEQNAEFEESVDRLIDQWRILDPTSMLQHVSFTLELLNSPQGL